MAWNPSVISGIGVVDNVRELYGDMHSYLAAAGAPNSSPPAPLRSFPTSHGVCNQRRSSASVGVVREAGTRSMPQCEHRMLALIVAAVSVIRASLPVCAGQAVQLLRICWCLVQGSAG